MVQIYIVNNDDKYELDNINVFSSIYNLKQTFKNTYNKRIKNNNIKTNKELSNKIKNNEFYFTYKRQRLEDDKTLYQYNIKNSSMIDINYLLPGGNVGSSISSVMMFFISLSAILLFYGFMCSGLISFFAKLYGYAVSVVIEKIFEFIYWFFGGKMTKESSSNSIINFFENIVIFLSIGLFLYISLFFVNNLTFSNIFFQNKCESLKNANRVSKITTITFLIIYFLLQIGDFILNIMVKITSYISSKTSKKIHLFSKFMEESTRAGKKAYNTLKYSGLFLIPFVGTSLQNYHIILSSFFNTINDAREKLSIENNNNKGIYKKRLIDCEKDKDKFASILNNNENFKELVARYQIKEANIKKYLNKETNMDKISYDDIISNNTLSNDERKSKLGIKFIYYIICNMLKIFSMITRSFDTIGSSTDIIDMIMSSSISGSIASFINFLSVLFVAIISIF